MSAVSFKEWPFVLGEDVNVSEGERQSFTITIRWYLRFCKQSGCCADFGSARKFIATVEAEKQPEEWVLERWSRKRLRLTRLSFRFMQPCFMSTFYIRN